MSMQSDITYGYGFTVENMVFGYNLALFIQKHIKHIAASKPAREKFTTEITDRIVNIIENTEIRNSQFNVNTPESADEIFETLLQPEDAQEIADFFESITDDKYFNHNGLDLIPIVINFETGLETLYVPSQEGCLGANCGAVLLPACMPWQFNEHERALSSESDLDEIFVPYMQELGIIISPDALGFQAIESFG